MLRAALPGHPLQKRMAVQWDIGAVLGADGAADESVSPQSGISGFADWSLCPRHVLRAPRAGAAGALPVAEVSRLDQPEIRLDGRR